MQQALDGVDMVANDLAFDRGLTDRENDNGARPAVALQLKVKAVDDVR